MKKQKEIRDTTNTVGSKLRTINASPKAMQQNVN